MSARAVAEALDHAGFNLFSVIDANSLTDSAIPARSESILLVGSAGQSLWRTMPACYHKKPDPVDEYTIDSVTRIMQEYAPAVETQLLYPHNESSPQPAPRLQALGERAGWHFPSPLGNGINHVFGLWFAYRAVVALAERWPASSPLSSFSPCVSCSATPCVHQCPASALRIGDTPDLLRCAEYRVRGQSDCAASCLARRSCPVVPEWQYSDEQMHHFYSRSLPALQRWVKNR